VGESIVTVRVFDLENPASAYVFGFMQADGHHRAGRGQKDSITIEIKVGDVDLLRAMQEVIPWRTSITFRTRRTNFAKSYESATLTLCALEGRRRLLELGLPCGRKSATLRPPVDPFSHRDYVRGLFDADGSVGFAATGLPFLSIVTASLAIAGYVRDEIRCVTGAQRTVRPNKRDGVVNLMIASDPAASFARWLYQDACIALARKHEAGLAVAAWQRPASMRARYVWKAWTPAEDAIVMLGMSQAETAQQLGRTIQSVNLRRWRLRQAAGTKSNDSAA